MLACCSACFITSESSLHPSVRGVSETRVYCVEQRSFRIRHVVSGDLPDDQPGSILVEHILGLQSDGLFIVVRNEGLPGVVNEVGNLRFFIPESRKLGEPRDDIVVKEPVTRKMLCVASGMR